MDLPSQITLPSPWGWVPSGQSQVKPLCGGKSSRHRTALSSHGYGSHASIFLHPSGPTPLPVIPGGHGPHLHGENNWPNVVLWCQKKIVGARVSKYAYMFVNSGEGKCLYGLESNRPTVPQFEHHHTHHYAPLKAIDELYLALFEHPT